MATRDRHLLEQLVKTWAQDHTDGYVIADPEPSDKGIERTGGFLTWLVQERLATLDLLSLVDHLEYFLIKKRRKGLDGLFCRKCQNFYEFAEPNQKDGSLICYSCRTNPYR